MRVERIVIDGVRPWLRLLPVLLPILLAAAGCHPDPYALFLKTLTPGEPVGLPGDRTLTFARVEGRRLSGVHLEGPAETCDGTLVLDAPEARIEPVEESANRRIRIVLVEPKAVERCGPYESVTTHERLTVQLDLDR